MESGEYFLAAEQKSAKRLAERDAKQDEGTAKSREKRKERFVAPKEQKRGAAGDAAAGIGATPERSAAELAAKFKAKGKDGKAAKRPAEAPPAAAAVADVAPPKKKKKGEKKGAA